MKKSIAFLTLSAALAAVPFAVFAQATGEANQGVTGATTTPGKSLLEGAKENAVKTGQAMKETGSKVAKGVKTGASAVASGAKKGATAVKEKVQQVRKDGVKVEPPKETKAVD